MEPMRCATMVVSVGHCPCSLSVVLFFMARTTKQETLLQVWRKKWETLSIPKRALSTIVFLAILLLFLNVVVAGLGSQRDASGISKNYAPQMGTSYGDYGGVAYEMAIDEFDSSYSRSTPNATPRLIPTPDTSGGTGGYDEATYETRSYHATYRTSQYDRTCNTIEAWKPRSEIIFEHASRGDDYCTYRFKAAPEHEAMIVATLEQLKPKDLTVETQTVKKQVVRYSGELDILLQKERDLAGLLNTANRSYDELTELYKDAENVDGLAKALRYKLEHIKTLTNERTMLARQIQGMERQIAELQDRIDYVTFDVTVERYEIIDSEAIRDSWVAEMKRFAHEVNRTFQALTLGLVLNLLQFAQFVLYAALLLVFVKYAWVIVRNFWKHTEH